MEIPKITSITLSHRELGDGAHGIVRQGRVRFKGRNQRHGGLRVAIKEIFEGLTDKEAAERQARHNRLASAGIPTVKLQLIKVFKTGPGKIEVLDNQTHPEWGNGKWIQVSQLFMRNGKSTLKRVDNRNKIPIRHAERFIQMVAQIANTDVRPAWDSIHSEGSPDRGKFRVVDEDLIEEPLDPAFAARDMFYHVNSINILPGEKQTWLKKLHDSLIDSKLREEFIKAIKREEKNNTFSKGK